MPEASVAQRRRVQIAPSILNADLARLGEAIRQLEEAGADLVHLDVMDGRFVPNISIGVPVVQAVSRITSLPLDVHLMIVEPERYVEQSIEAGAHYVTVHVESSPHLHRTVQQIHEHGALAGVALNPATPVSAVEEIVATADLILAMSVNPGFGGQSFIPTTLDKIRRLRALLDERGSRAKIEVDGGVKASNIRRVVDAGAEIIVAGTAIFSPEHTVREGIEALQAALA